MAIEIVDFSIDSMVIFHSYVTVYQRVHGKMLWPRCTLVKSCKLALPNLTRNMSVVSTITPWISLSSVDLGRQWRNLANGPRAWTLSADGWWVCGYYLRDTNTCGIHSERDGMTILYIYITGCWFGTMEFYDFPFSWGFHHPNWRSHIFQRGRSTPFPTSGWGFHSSTSLGNWLEAPAAHGVKWLRPREGFLRPLVGVVLWV